jgi:hypothetical protein
MNHAEKWLTSHMDFALLYLLMLAHKQQQLEALGAAWERYYADFLVGRYA